MARRRLRDYAKRHWMKRAAEIDRTPVEPVGEEELFAEPPGPDQVARRAAILAAVVARGLIEADQELPDHAAALAEDLAFYDQLGLATHAEPQEDALIRAPHGTLEPQAMIDATWRAEGLAVLAWALGQLDALPPIDETIELDVLAERLGLPWKSAADVGIVRSPHLRPAADLDKLDAQLLTAHWRVRQFLQLDPAPMDYVSWVPDVQWAQLSLDGLEVRDRDLAIGGLPITEADPERVQTASSILVERRLAVSWLGGYDELYSEGDTNT